MQSMSWRFPCQSESLGAFQRLSSRSLNGVQVKQTKPVAPLASHSMDSVHFSGRTRRGPKMVMEEPIVVKKNDQMVLSGSFNRLLSQALQAGIITKQEKKQLTDRARNLTLKPRVVLRSKDAVGIRWSKAYLKMAKSLFDLERKLNPENPGSLIPFVNVNDISAQFETKYWNFSQGLKLAKPENYGFYSLIRDDGHMLSTEFPSLISGSFQDACLPIVMSILLAHNLETQWESSDLRAEMVKTIKDWFPFSKTTHQLKPNLTQAAKRGTVKQWLNLSTQTKEHKITLSDAGKALEQESWPSFWKLYAQYQSLSLSEKLALLITEGIREHHIEQMPSTSAVQNALDLNDNNMIKGAYRALANDRIGILMDLKTRQDRPVYGPKPEALTTPKAQLLEKLSKTETTKEKGIFFHWQVLSHLLENFETLLILPDISEEPSP